MFASLSILGLYEYNEDIFANLHLPDGVDADILIPEICTECSDFALLYPDYDFMKMLIGVWSTKEQRIWAAMVESTEFEYNPIENFDRYENISRSITSSATGSSTSSGSVAEQNNGTSTGSQTAFNSDAFKDTNKTTSSGTGSTTTQGSDSAQQSGTGTETVSTHLHGNIGVTTAQQMIAGFREISNFSVYDFIVQSFKDRFCVQVY